MKTILAKRKISTFESFADLVAWLSRYHVYSTYGKHIVTCWDAYKGYKPEAHQLDYLILIFRNQAGKYCVKIIRKMKLLELPEAKETHEISDPLV